MEKRTKKNIHGLNVHASRTVVDLLVVLMCGFSHDQPWLHNNAKSSLRVWGPSFLLLFIVESTTRLTTPSDTTNSMRPMPPRRPISCDEYGTPISMTSQRQGSRRPNRQQQQQSWPTMTMMRTPASGMWKGALGRARDLRVSSLKCVFLAIFFWLYRLLLIFYNWTYLYRCHNDDECPPTHQEPRQQC